MLDESYRATYTPGLSPKRKIMFDEETIATDETTEGAVEETETESAPEGTDEASSDESAS